MTNCYYWITVLLTVITAFVYMLEFEWFEILFAVMIQSHAWTSAFSWMMCQFILVFSAVEILMNNKSYFIFIHWILFLFYWIFILFY